MTRHLPALLFLALLAGCGGRATNATRSEHEQDSMLANSKVPGATAVRRAMTVSDSARSRATQLDSASTEP